MARRRGPLVSLAAAAADSGNLDISGSLRADLVLVVVASEFPSILELSVSASLAPHRRQSEASISATLQAVALLVTVLSCLLAAGRSLCCPWLRAWLASLYRLAGLLNADNGITNRDLAPCLAPAAAASDRSIAASTTGSTATMPQGGEGVLFFWSPGTSSRYRPVADRRAGLLPCLVPTAECLNRRPPCALTSR